MMKYYRKLLTIKFKSIQKTTDSYRVKYKKFICCALPGGTGVCIKNVNRESSQK